MGKRFAAANEHGFRSLRGAMGDDGRCVHRSTIDCSCCRLTELLLGSHAHGLLMFAGSIPGPKGPT